MVNSIVFAVILVVGFTTAFVYAEIPIISITGDPNPALGRVYSLNVHVEGKPYNFGESSMTLYPKEQGEGTVIIPVKLYEGDNTITLNLIDYGFGSGLAAGVTYVFEIRNLNVISTFEITPKEKPSVEELPPTFANNEMVSVRIIDIVEEELFGIVTFEVCAKQDITTPQFYIYSDSKKILYGKEIKLEQGKCFTDSATILAKSPKTINIPLAEHEPPTGNVDEVDRLKAEIQELKEQLKKKDEVLMEQLKVIMELANKIKNTFYDSIMNYFIQI